MSLLHQVSGYRLSQKWERRWKTIKQRFSTEIVWGQLETKPMESQNGRRGTSNRNGGGKGFMFKVLNPSSQNTPFALCFCVRFVPGVVLSSFLLLPLETVLGIFFRQARLESKCQAALHCKVSYESKNEDCINLDKYINKHSEFYSCDGFPFESEGLACTWPSSLQSSLIKQI